MRTRTTQSLLSLFACFALLAGCSSDVSDTGSALHEVDVELITSQTLYVVPDMLVPLTAEEAEGYEDAIPVRVELLENTAVAWYAPEGEAIVSRETIIALWGVVERTPINDTLAAGEEPSVVLTPGTNEAASLPSLLPEYEGVLVDSELTVTNPRNSAETAILDFLDRLGSPEELPMMRELGGAHPGCI
ncbi:MAG: hypothetical protein AB8I08_15630 [Sandaracinaceae bacterium]